MSLTPKQKFGMQKVSAKNRNIEWKLTFEEWLSWWGNDFEKRGCAHADNLVMARIGDKGPYSLDNIIKLTVAENARDCRSRNKFKGRPIGSYITSIETRQKISAANKKSWEARR